MKCTQSYLCLPFGVCHMFVSLDHYCCFQTCANFVAFSFMLGNFFLLPKRYNRVRGVMMDHVWNTDHYPSIFLIWVILSFSAFWLFLWYICSNLYNNWRILLLNYKKGGSSLPCRIFLGSKCSSSYWYHSIIPNSRTLFSSLE